MEETTNSEAASMQEHEHEHEPNKSSLFPLVINNSTTNHQNIPPPNAVSPQQWLSNTSFTTDISVINTAVSSLYDHLNNSDDDEEQQQSYEPATTSRPSSQPSNLHQLIEDSSASDAVDVEKKERRKKKRRRRRHRDKDDDDDVRGDDFKFRSKAWATGSSVKSSIPAKDYYVDSRGDRDNLAFGCLYRMDLPRYKLINSKKVSELELQGLYMKSGSILDKDSDIDKLDSKLKSGGRYWSAKYSALERHKNLKHVRIVAPKAPGATTPSDADDFVPLSTDIQSSGEGIDGESAIGTSVIEESWEDEVLRKTKEFNKMTREHPHDQKAWSDFAEFQDRVASMQPNKGARLQTLEKKISILEKATELNQENEELLLCLLKAYQSRDSMEVLIARWEKVLIQNSGSHNLWKEFLRVVQGEFSSFKVSDMRKMNIHAIQALASKCSKQYRFTQTADTGCQDPSTLQQELGLVDIFVSLCRFEWQSGYQELATACFQSEIEYSLFCPPLHLTESSKQRLFEHFWNSDCPRIGEEGALGWSTWLAKVEENRQRVVQEERCHEEEGGWTGWSEPFSKQVEDITDPAKVVDDVSMEPEEEPETQVEMENDTESMLKMLGIDIEAEASDEVKDSSTWNRWSREESLRDSEQWMPFHEKSAVNSHTGASPDRKADEQLTRVVLFEDVSDLLFSLSSIEARLSLILQFIDFFGGKVSHGICTNSSSWSEKLHSLDTFPDFVVKYLGKIHDVLSKSQTTCDGLSLELLLGDASDIAKRTSMMKFLRNAMLLSLTVFPRNYNLEEAVLVAEEMSITKLNSSNCSVTPCRALAKGLLKSDRQDVLLCGVYAKREAMFGNIDLARKVFDMALSSIEGLPLDVQSNAPSLYFWYAEVEMANNISGNNSESCLRAIHILTCLGSGVTYSPFKSQASPLQLLKAHQGFKERMRTVWSAWARGTIHDSSIALICSAALFEESTTGGAAGVKVLEEALSMVLPERKRQSYQLEYLFEYYLRMLQTHCKISGPSKVLELILQGLQIYPFSAKILNSLVEISHLYSLPNQLRRIFDGICHKKPSVIVWIFALSYEISKGGSQSQHRVHALFERALSNEQLHSSVLLWRCYIAFEVEVVGNLSAARKVFFRAIHACPWSKKLWLDGFRKLSEVLTAKELSDLEEVMRDKEINLRTDIYEILLQDETKS